MAEAKHSVRDAISCRNWGCDHSSAYERFTLMERVVEASRDISGLRIGAWAELAAALDALDAQSTGSRSE